LLALIGLIVSCSGPRDYGPGGDLSGLGLGRGIVLREAVSDQRTALAQDGGSAFSEPAYQRRGIPPSGFW